MGALLFFSLAVLFGSPDHAPLCCAFASLGYTAVTLQVNFPWEITFDTLYTNEFLLEVHSRALAIPSERTII